MKTKGARKRAVMQRAVMMIPERCFVQFINTLSTNTHCTPAPFTLRGVLLCVHLA